MSVLFIVLPIALVLAAGAIFAFIWSIKQGQMDDLSTPAVRLLGDECEIKSTSKNKGSQS